MLNMWHVGFPNRSKSQPKRRGLRHMSMGTLFAALIFAVLAGLLYWAGANHTSGNPLAMDICNRAYSWCQHPMRIGIFSVGALIAHFLVRGVRY